MTNNVAENTNNVTQIDNVPAVKRGRGRPRKIIDINVAVIPKIPKKRGRPKNEIPTVRQYPKKYWGEGAYYNVTLHLDPAVGKALRIMAIKEDTPIGKLASEAIAAWIQWLAKASREELGKREMEKEFDEMAAEMQEYRSKLWTRKMTDARKRIYLKKIAKALKSKKKWKAVFPNRRWPGDKLAEMGNVAEINMPQI